MNTWNIERFETFQGGKHYKINITIMKNTIEDLKHEFHNIELIKCFEIEVANKKDSGEEWLVFNISIQENNLVAQHVALTQDECISDKIAFKSIELDECFSLTEHLQELHEECTTAIMYSDFFTLKD